jgi:hypothetical protein
VPRAAPIRLQREPQGTGGRIVVHVAGAVARRASTACGRGRARMTRCAAPAGRCPVPT